MNEHDNDFEESRIRELEKECAHLSAENKLFKAEHKYGASLITLVVAGPRLVKACRNWLIAVMAKKETLPINETAELAAAVIRVRAGYLLLGFLGMAVATITPALLYFQNDLIRSQNQCFQDQNEIFREDSTRARRTEYLGIIYDEECNIETKEGNWCQPKAHLRSRTEAALALIELDRSQNKRPSLAEVKLAEANLEQIDLSDVNMIDADLHHAILFGTNLARTSLNNAHLEHSILTGAKLGRANLEWAQLDYANLVNADLNYANLVNADLICANLANADLSHANITRTSLEKAIINEATVLPLYLNKYQNDLINLSIENKKPCYPDNESDIAKYQRIPSHSY